MFKGCTLGCSCILKKINDTNEFFVCYIFEKMAERVGFEPTVHCCTQTFEIRTLSHSDTSPLSLILLQKIHISKFLQVITLLF